MPIYQTFFNLHFFISCFFKLSAVDTNWYPARERWLSDKLTLLPFLLLAISLQAQPTDRTLQDSIINQIYSATSDSIITEHLNRITQDKPFSDSIRNPQNARELKRAVFSVSIDSSLRSRAINILSIAFGYQNQLDSAIHYKLKVAEWHCSKGKSEGSTREAYVTDAMFMMQLQQNWDDIIFWSDSLLKNKEQIDILDLQNIYLRQQTALAEIGDFAGGLESSQALLGTINPEDKDYDLVRAFAIDRLAELQHLNRNYVESRRWLNELMQLAEATRDTFSFTEYKTKLGIIFIEEGNHDKGRQLLQETLPELIRTEQEVKKEYAAGGYESLYESAYDYWPVKGASITARIALIKSAVGQKSLIDAGLRRDIVHLQKQIDRNEKYESFTVQLEVLDALTEYYTASGNYSSALVYARQRLAVAEENTRDFSPHVEQSLRLLHTIENKVGARKEAYQTLIKHQEYTEGLKSQVDANRLARAEAAINLDEAERARQIAERATLAEKKAAALRNRNFWLALIATGLILAITSWAFLRSRRDQRLITAQKMAISQSLSEKEVLLREIHHRVKNNLQIISSLLQKQARLAGDGDAKKMAKEGQERIQSMALIHQNLYQSEQLSGVNIRSYLEDLGKNIGRSHAKPDTEIKLELVVEDQYLDLDTAIPVGLILNELLTNAYKYAFPGGEVGHIQVIFQRVGDKFEMEVNDNGVGLPADHAERIKKSLGHNLVKGLVRQLEGKMTWLKPEQGTGVQIRFQSPAP